MYILTYFHASLESYESDFFIIKNMAYSNSIIGADSKYLDIYMYIKGLTLANHEYLMALNSTDVLKCCWANDGPSGHLQPLINGFGRIIHYQTESHPQEDGSGTVDMMSFMREGIFENG